MASNRTVLASLSIWLFALTSCAGLYPSSSAGPSCSNVFADFKDPGKLDRHLRESIRRIDRKSEGMTESLARAIQSEHGVDVVEHSCEAGALNFVRFVLAFPSRSEPWYELHVPIRRNAAVWSEAVVVKIAE